MDVEDGESGIESDGPMVNYISGVYGTADGTVVAVVSENCVRRTVIQIGSDGVAVVESARKTGDLDAGGEMRFSEFEC